MKIEVSVKYNLEETGLYQATIRVYLPTMEGTDDLQTELVNSRQDFIGENRASDWGIVGSGEKVGFRFRDITYHSRPSDIAEEFSGRVEGTIDKMLRDLREAVADYNQKLQATPVNKVWEFTL